MEYFKFDIIDENTPLNKDNFFTWLRAKGEKQYNRTDAICDYLDSLGFVTGKDKIKESDWDTLGHVFDVYFRTWQKDYTPVPLAEFFDTKDGGEFWVKMEYGKASFHGTPTKKLLALIPDTLVYPTTPGNYYFEVSKNRLFIKYQNIIGGRRLATIK